MQKPLSYRRCVACFLFSLGSSPQYRYLRMRLPRAAWSSAGARAGARLQPAVYPRNRASGLRQDPATVSVIPFDAAPRRSKPRRADGRSRLQQSRQAQVDADQATRRRVIERRHVKDGMSDGEVLSRLGPPDLQSGKTGRKMRWTYLPAPGDPQTVTLLRFEDGRVVAVERTTLR